MNIKYLQLAKIAVNEITRLKNELATRRTNVYKFFLEPKTINYLKREFGRVKMSFDFPGHIKIDINENGKVVLAILSGRARSFINGIF